MDLPSLATVEGGAAVGLVMPSVGSPAVVQGPGLRLLRESPLPKCSAIFFFFLVAEPGTYGSSQARDRGIEPKPQLQPRLQLQLQQLGILNLPHKAGGSNLSLPSDLSCCSRILNPLHYSENFKFSCF